MVDPLEDGGLGFDVQAVAAMVWSGPGLTYSLIWPGSAESPLCSLGSQSPSASFP